jgi:hypothetical protein
MVRLIFKKHQSNICGVEVTETATLSDIRDKTILLFLLLLNNFGDFRWETCFVIGIEDRVDTLATGEIITVVVKNFRSSCKNYCGKLNRPFKF